MQFLQGNFLDDMHKLHLPTLTWRAPPKIHGRPIRALRNIAGHSMDGLIAFGGCIPTVMGIMPVAKADPLLIGKQPCLVDVIGREKLECFSQTTSLISTACPPSYSIPAIVRAAAAAASSVIVGTSSVASADRVPIGEQSGAVLFNTACPLTQALCKGRYC